jgi:hypothetical protein
LLLFEGTFPSYPSKEVTKQQESRFFLLFLLGDRRIKDPDLYPDPGGPKTYGSDRFGSGFGSGSTTLVVRF